MLQELQKFGLDQKEAEAFLVLLEYGPQPASIVAKKMNLPRTTVLYALENLYKHKMVTKSFTGKTQYFKASIERFKNSREKELSEKHANLKKLIPQLAELEKEQKSPARIEFFEGISGCRKAYEKVLSAKSSIYEFTTHEDLEKMGSKFMKDFLDTRIKNKNKIRVICQDIDVHKKFEKLNKKQLREMKMFSKNFGRLYSSIDVYDDEIIILNLYGEPFAIHIVNDHLAETLKTLHDLIWEKL